MATAQPLRALGRARGGGRKRTPIVLSMKMDVLRSLEVRWPFSRMSWPQAQRPRHATHALPILGCHEA
eukprot:4218708-Prymnesium_polylepis.1